MPGHRKSSRHMAGRPPGAKLLTFNAQAKDRALIEHAAKISGLSQSEIMRTGALEKARQILEAKGQLELFEVEQARQIIARYEQQQGQKQSA